MAKAKRKCKLCGAEYEYCTTDRPSTVFRWQDVACCPEHGAEYLALIRQDRGTLVEPDAVQEEVDDLVEQLDVPAEEVIEVVEVEKAPEKTPKKKTKKNKQGE